VINGPGIGSAAVPAGSPFVSPGSGGGALEIPRGFITPGRSSGPVPDRWLPAWGLAAVAYGGASLVVPLYLVELGGDAFELGVLFATGSFVGVPAALAFGALADRTGRRRAFVLAAVAVAAATTAAIPLTDSRLLVVVANAVLWFGFAAALPVLTLLVVAGAPADRWTELVARLNTYQGVGWAMGLAVGVAVTVAASRLVDPVTAQRWVLFACAASAGAGLVLAVRRLPPDHPEDEPSPRRLRRRVGDAARLGVRGASFPFAPGRFDARRLRLGRFAERFTPRLATYFGAVTLVFAGFGAFFAPLPAYLGGVGYGPSAVFGLYLALNVAGAVAYGPAAALAERFELRVVHVAGLAARALAFPAVAATAPLAGVAGLAAVGLVFAVVGASWAVIAVTATTLVTRLAPHGVRGEALGVYGALGAVGGGVGGLLGGWLAGRGFLLTFAVAGGLVAVGAAVVLRLSGRPAPTPGEAAAE